MKKVLSLILSIVMLITMVTISTVSASAATAADAVQWVKNQNGKTIDYDGVYGGQCVDLIMAYYKYLAGYNVSGNAVDYQWNSLPSGWWRDHTPEPGAVIVWGAGAYMGKSGHYADSTYGHVGIVTSVSGGSIDYYDQNSYQYGQKVGLHTGHAANSAACYIHPSFILPPPGDPWVNVYADGITETNAVLHASVNPMQASTSIGVQLATSPNELSLWCEDVGNVNFIDAWFNLNEYGKTLKPGTTYYYRFFFYNGADYVKFSETMSFKTQCSHSYTSSITKAATCTEKGKRTYTCSKCGYMYSEDINATGHSWNQPVFTFSADGKTATAKRVCKNNSAHTEDANVTVTSKVTKEPTTTTKGETTYTATAVFGGQTYTDSKTIADIPETKPAVIDPDAPQIVVGGKTTTARSTVDVTISLKNNPGIVGMNLDVSFDSSVLTLKKVTDGGILGTNTHKPELKSPYTLSWSNDTLTQNITANGTIATLTFTVSDDAAVGTYPIVVSYDYNDYDIYNKDLEAVEFAIVDASVTVADVILGDVNGDSKVNNLDRVYLTRYLANWDDYQEINLAAADVDGNGKVNNLDKVILTRHLANWDAYAVLPYVG